MLIEHTIPFIGKRRRRQSAPAALVLTAASYEVATSITLSFNRAIDISQIDVAQFFVSDGGSSHHQYQGTGSAMRIGPASVQIELADIGHAIGHGTTMNALPTNGIAGASDGLPWTGVDGLELPFP